MAPIRRCETGSAQGFTLTEMLVVLAIIGLLIAAIPVLLQSALPGARSLAAARGLADALKAERGSAIAHGAAVVVRFDAARQVYRLGDRARKLPDAVPFALPHGVAAESIAFYADGSSSGGTVLVGDGAKRHRIAVDWLTGRVAIDE